MPNFPIAAPVTTTQNALASFMDASGKTQDIALSNLPVAATSTQINALITAMGDISNAGVSKTLISTDKQIPGGDVLAYDDAESSVTARAVFSFENALFVRKTFSVPAPDISIFDASGENVLPTGSNALVAALVAAALAVLNAGGGTYVYDGGKRDDVPYVENTPLWMAIGTAQDDATKALEDSASALAVSSALVAPVFAVMMDEAVFNITPSRLVSAQYPYNYGVYTTTPAAATKKFSARDGKWNIHILTYKGSNAGQLTVAIDGTTILLNLELYVASPAFAPYNHNLTNITIVGNGWHEVQISCSSKHGSSASFGLLVFKIWGERTGA